ncbi:alpha/beta-hydrolase [Fistulina hepatica ATCC 64428]|nr:alpha/beta-hydrolase [Fistulina hepatica ATCC 64428]
MFRVEDKRLTLPDGRVLAYADAGNTSSNTVVLFLHSAFDVGDASRPPLIVLKNNLHFVAPTLPGWGKSSPVSRVSAYAQTILTDMSFLLDHLHPAAHRGRGLDIILCGQGLGTIAAQILFSAPTAAFPPSGCRINKLVLVSPCSPPRLHRAHSAFLTGWAHILLGSHLIPSYISTAVAKYVASRQLRSTPETQSLVRCYLSDGLGDDGQHALEAWEEAHGRSASQLERDIAVKAAQSVACSWRGFGDLPVVFHSDWLGMTVRPDQSGSGGVFIVIAKSDTVISPEFGRWLASEYYENATLLCVEGGHLSTIFWMEKIWQDILTR